MMIIGEIGEGNFFMPLTLVVFHQSTDIGMLNRDPLDMLDQHHAEVLHGIMDLDFAFLESELRT